MYNINLYRNNQIVHVKVKSTNDFKYLQVYLNISLE